MGINCFTMAFMQKKNGQKLPCEFCARSSVAGTERHCAGQLIT